MSLPTQIPGMKHLGHFNYGTEQHMKRRIVTITHGSGGITMSFNNGGSFRWSNVEHLAEAHAQAVLTNLDHERHVREIRQTLIEAERLDTVEVKNVVAAIRKILDEDVPF